MIDCTVLRGGIRRPFLRLLKILDLLLDVVLQQVSLQLVIILHFLEYVTHLGQESHFPVEPFDLLLDPGAGYRVPLLVLHLRLARGRPFLRIGGSLVRRKMLGGHHVIPEDGLKGVKFAILNRQLVTVDVGLTVTVLDILVPVLPRDELEDLLLLSVVVLDLLEPLLLLGIDRLIAVLSRLFSFFRRVVNGAASLFPVIHGMLLPNADVPHLFFSSEVLLLLHVGGERLGGVLIGVDLHRLPILVEASVDEGRHVLMT